MIDLKIDNTCEKETWEQTKYRAEQLISTILLQADFFEMRTRIKPTVFMSFDLFAIVVAATRDIVVHRIDRNQTAHTIGGYDLELIHQGTNLLYVGYKVNMPF
jgi:hypothetical protein